MVERIDEKLRTTELASDLLKASSHDELHVPKDGVLTYNKDQEMTLVMMRCGCILGNVKVKELKIKFGLVSQGKVLLVWSMRKTGHSWEAIGNIVNWEPNCLKQQYEHIMGISIQK